MIARGGNKGFFAAHYDWIAVGLGAVMLVVGIVFYVSVLGDDPDEAAAAAVARIDRMKPAKTGVTPVDMSVFQSATSLIRKPVLLAELVDERSESFLASEVEGSLTGIGPTPTEYEYGAPYSASRTLVPRRVELTDIIETDGGPCAQLAFSGDGFGTESVCLVWGERDFGDAVVAWPNWRDAGILSADRSEGSYPLSLTEKPKGGFVKAFLMTDFLIF